MHWWMVIPGAIVRSFHRSELTAATVLFPNSPSFRGQPPIADFAPVGGMPLVIFWYAKPLLATLVIGTATAAWAARPATVWASFFWLLVSTAGVAAWGLALVDKRDRRS
jgi:hypothetical protein